jgi:hypothetical protein
MLCCAFSNLIDFSSQMCHVTSAKLRSVCCLRTFLVEACILLLISCFSRVSSSLHAHTVAFEPEQPRIVLNDVELHASAREFRPGRLLLREIDDSNTRIQFKQIGGSFDTKRSADHRAARADTDLCHSLGWRFPPKYNQDETHRHSWAPLEWQVPERDLSCSCTVQFLIGRMQRIADNLRASVQSARPNDCRARCRRKLHLSAHFS